MWVPIIDILYQNVLNNPTCMYDHCYSMCGDNMDIITVLWDTIDVRDGFKTCAYYTNNEVEDLINDRSPMFRKCWVCFAHLYTLVYY